LHKWFADVRHCAIEGADNITRTCVSHPGEISLKDSRIEPPNQSSLSTFQGIGGPFSLSQRERAGVKESCSIQTIPVPVHGEGGLYRVSLTILLGVQESPKRHRKSPAPKINRNGLKNFLQTYGTKRENCERSPRRVVG
jgi:hypothetical protein